QIHTYWDLRYRYSFRDSEGRTDLLIKFEPRKGKFYGIGLANIGDPIPDEKHNTFERKNRFIGVLGNTYGPFEWCAGAIRARAGAGGSVKPLYLLPKWRDRLVLNTEIYDFSRDETIKGQHVTKPVWNLGSNFAVSNYIWLGARVEDVLEHAA